MERTATWRYSSERLGRALFARNVLGWSIWKISTVFAIDRSTVSRVLSPRLQDGRTTTRYLNLTPVPFNPARPLDGLED
jgi:hypothetical protein